MQILQRFWNEEAGFVASVELTIIATIAVLVLIVGLASVRDGVAGDVAGAVHDPDQSVNGIVGHASVVLGMD